MKKIKGIIPVVILLAAVCGIAYKQNKTVVWDKEPVVMYNGYIFDCNDSRGVEAENLPGEIVCTVEIESTTENEWPSEHLQSNSFAVGEKFYFVSGWPNVMYWYNESTDRYYPYEMNYDEQVTIPMPGTDEYVTLTPMLMYDGRLYIAHSYSRDYTLAPADNEKDNIFIEEMIPPLEIPQENLQCNFRSGRTQLHFRENDPAIYLDCWDYTHGYVKMVKAQ